MPSHQIVPHHNLPKKGENCNINQLIQKNHVAGMATQHEKLQNSSANSKQHGRTYRITTCQQSEKLQH
jgi:hypothetical protein